jgi:hypothetical protein
MISAITELFPLWMTLIWTRNLSRKKITSPQATHIAWLGWLNTIYFPQMHLIFLKSTFIKYPKLKSFSIPTALFCIVPTILEK